MYACESSGHAADELTNVPRSTKDIMQHDIIITAGDCQLKGFGWFLSLGGAHIILPRDEEKQLRSTCFASELQFHIGISSAKDSECQDTNFKRQT